MYLPLLWWWSFVGCSWFQAPAPPAGLEADPDVGRWERARDDRTDEMKRLEAIGYVGGEVPGDGQKGVTVHEPEAWSGLNLMVSGHAPVATLLAMDGTVLHRWSRTFAEIWPEREVEPGQHGPEFWRRASLLPDGSLLAIFEGHGLVKLDRDSNVVWRWEGSAHHDLEVLPDGRIWVLARQAVIVGDLHPLKPVLEDLATLLSPDGEVLQTISVLEAVRDSGAEAIMNRIPARRHGDIFHTNSIEVLHGEGAFGEGNLLLSMRATSSLLVLDPNTRRLTWWHHGAYQRQHDPTVLPNGNLLLFDNLGAGFGTSRVLEQTLPGMEEVWSFAGTEERPFFTRFCGSSQRLPGGTTLMVESGQGRVLEVTPEGRVVWAFHNPERAGPDGEFVAIVPDMVRLPLDAAPWLATLDPDDSAAG